MLEPDYNACDPQVRSLTIPVSVFIENPNINSYLQQDEDEDEPTEEDEEDNADL